MQCAGSTLPDPSAFSPAFLLYAIATPSNIDNRRQSQSFAERGRKMGVKYEVVERDRIREHTHTITYPYCGSRSMGMLPKFKQFFKALQSSKVPKPNGRSRTCGLQSKRRCSGLKCRRTPNRAQLFKAGFALLIR
ncbi:hypothetical protein EVAR_102945_1 [Eumeta japonica]|uniref:Uncharacterized protein n=1 Tax=Eumeta variegata TaxID=151549 RepID=A0A4C1UPM3_EUMVA|nr:hypothetical protein EVAR_102945_1 [Eumeta japonica]